MKDLFSEHKEFIYSLIAVFLGTTTGFVAGRFINEKLSNHAFYNCPTKNLVFIQDKFMGAKYICLNK